MKQLRPYLISLIALTLTVLTVAAPRVLAVDVTSGVCDATNNKPVICNDVNGARNTNPLLGKDGVVTHGVQIFMLIIGIISVFVILINATKMITANGDPSSVSKARNGLIYAAIGLAVAMASQLIVITLVNKL